MAEQVPEPALTLHPGAPASGALPRALEAALVGVWSYDLATGKVEWSACVHRFFGVSKAEFDGTYAGYLALVHPDDRARVESAIEAALEAAQPDLLVEHRCARSGLWVECRGQTLLGPDGEPLGMLGVVQDVTRRVAAERELRESRTLLERAAHASPHILYVFDVVERCNVYANRQIARDLGYTPEQIAEMGSDFLPRLIHPDDAQRLGGLLARWDTAADGEILEVEYRMRHADGSWRYFLGRDTVFTRDPDGRVRQIVGTAQDMTVRQQMQAQLLRAQKLESVGRLAGGVAHDFNNLLTAILGFADTIRGSLPSGSEALADLDELASAAQRGAALTRQLLSFARRDATVPTVTDLNVTVVSLAGLLRRLLGSSIALELRPTAAACCALIDPGQLEQVVLNLAINARDAMPGGGRLELRVERRREGEQQVAVLSVADTGTGMSPDVKAHLFEPFFTTKPPGRGTGLGLSTCYGIVTQNHGRIEVESELGRGSTFSVYLPLVEGECPARPAEPPAAEAAGLGRTVLVVDDEPAVRLLMVKLLRGSGYAVHEADSLPAALRVLRQLPSPPDVLVTDLVMPGGSGHELAEVARRFAPQLRVLFVSGYVDDADSLSLEPASQAFVHKPFSPRVFVARVRALADLARSLEAASPAG